MTKKKIDKTKKSHNLTRHDRAMTDTNVRAAFGALKSNWPSRFDVPEILRDCSIDCLGLRRIWFRLRFDISCKGSHLEVPGI